MRAERISQALIMAAGRGNRLRPLTDLLPKSMIPYRGDTLIGNSLKELNACVDAIHVTVGYKKAILSEYLMTKGVNTIINTEGHGNAWWITNSLMKYISEPILTLTTDNITEIDIDFLSEEYQRLNQPACMLVPVKPIPGIEGDFIFQNEGIVESVNRDYPSEIYCTGIQVLNPYKVNSIIPSAENFYEIWNSLIKQRQLVVSRIYPKKWFSIDTIEQLSMSINNDQ